MKNSYPQDAALWLILIPDIVLTVIAGIAISLTTTGMWLGSDSALTSLANWFSILSVALAIVAVLNLIGAIMFLASSLKAPRQRKLAM